MESYDSQQLLLQTPAEKRLAIISETFQQLQKDTGAEEQMPPFDGHTEHAYRVLLEFLEPYLTETLQNNSQRFSRILYKVDISEAALHRKLKANPEKPYVRVVTEMIIYRSFQKVITKMWSRAQNL